MCKERHISRRKRYAELKFTASINADFLSKIILLLLSPNCSAGFNYLMCVLTILSDAMQLARRRGVGVWNLETLDYDSTDTEVAELTAEMWDALKTFTGQG